MSGGASSGPVIAALVLAAGSSSRFGEPKLLAPLGGTSLIRLAVQNALASRVDEVLVVVGAEGADVERAVEDLPVTVVHNPGHTEGMSSSLRVGVEALPPDVEWVVVLLADQPGVTPELVDRILDARDPERPVVAPVYRGEQGNPVAFHASVFSELRALTGDGGGRPVVERDPARVTRVELDRPMPRDVDTPEDYRRLRAEGPGAE